jgi:hypothetical protein
MSIFDRPSKVLRDEVKSDWRDFHSNSTLWAALANKYARYIQELKEHLEAAKTPEIRLMIESVIFDYTRIQQLLSSHSTQTFGGELLEDMPRLKKALQKTLDQSESAEASRKKRGLPVIKTCADCAHMREREASYFCEWTGHITAVRLYSNGNQPPRPPTECPLRNDQ